MTKTFDFNEQYKIGLKGEMEVYETLDNLGWKVEPMQDLFLQSRGLDAFITKEKQSFSVEVKTDLRAARTGNAFLELKIVKDGVESPGWVYKTCAQIVLYYVPQIGIYALNTIGIRKQVELGIGSEERTIDNGSFAGVGILYNLAALYARAGIWKYVW